MDKSLNYIFCVSVRPSLEPGWLEGNLEGKVGFDNQLDHNILLLLENQWDHWKLYFSFQVGLVPENYVEFLSWSREAPTFGLNAEQNIKDLKFQDWIF